MGIEPTTRSLGRFASKTHFLLLLRWLSLIPEGGSGLSRDFVRLSCAARRTASSGLHCLRHIVDAGVGIAHGRSDIRMAQGTRSFKCKWGRPKNLMS
jgi:hypothetical protein